MLNSSCRLVHPSMQRTRTSPLYNKLGYDPNRSTRLLMLDLPNSPIIPQVNIHPHGVKIHGSHVSRLQNASLLWQFGLGECLLVSSVFTLETFKFHKTRYERAGSRDGRRKIERKAHSFIMLITDLLSQQLHGPICASGAGVWGVYTWDDERHGCGGCYCKCSM